MTKNLTARNGEGYTYIASGPDEIGLRPAVATCQKDGPWDLQIREEVDRRFDREIALLLPEEIVWADECVDMAEIIPGFYIAEFVETGKRMPVEVVMFDGLEMRVARPGVFPTSPLKDFIDFVSLPESLLR